MLTGLANTKSDSLWAPASTATNATATGYVDTIGWNYCTVSLHLATGSATTAATTWKLSEADVTTISSTSAIATFTGGTATSSTVGFAIPATDTSNAKVWKMHIDLRGRKRYIFGHYTPGVAQVNGADYTLQAGKESPDTAAEAGVPVRVVG